MNQREKNILDDLFRFRCMSRDDLADIHFSNTKYSIKNANEVLKRMRRDGLIEADTDMKPYIYFPADSTMKRGSQKLNHFLSIVGVYRDIRRQVVVKVYEVEPKLGKKGTVEPDIFTVIVYNRMVFSLFIEVQNSQCSNKIMQEKMDRYEEFYKAGDWRQEWKAFPNIVLLSRKPYEVYTEHLTVWQYKSIGEFLERHIKPVERPQSNINGVKIKGLNLTMK